MQDYRTGRGHHVTFLNLGMFNSDAVSPAFKFVVRMISFVGFCTRGVSVFQGSWREKGSS